MVIKPPTTPLKRGNKGGLKMIKSPNEGGHYISDKIKV